MTLLRTQLGNTLRGHRLRQRRTLRDVSGAARVSLGYLSEVERGQKEASSELLASICDALDVELADLAVAEPAADDAAQVAEAPAAAPVAEAPAAEPALALVGGAQPARDAARAHGAVCLAA
jgi:transcriptional regulator with XRE-family HTH domain